MYSGKEFVTDSDFTEKYYLLKGKTYGHYDEIPGGESKSFYDEL